MLCNRDELVEKNTGVVIDECSCMVEKVESRDSAVSVLEGLCVKDDVAMHENSGILAASPMVSEDAGRKNFEKSGYRL